MILRTDLQPHQVQAVEKLKPIKVGALYMEMGTGKTRTAHELIAQRYNSGKIDRVLWLCPFSAKTNILRECEKHLVTGIDIFRIEGIESLSSSIRLNTDLIDMVKNYRTYIIVDESNLVKNHRALRTQNIQRLADFCGYKALLNGTPIGKSEKDLFSQWKILDWRILGYQSFWSFAANHLVYDERIPGRIVRTLNTEYLVHKIEPYTYQVRKKDCLSLPGKVYDEWNFSLTENQRDIYEDVKNKFLMQLDELDSTTIYRLFTALQHVVSGRRVVTNYWEPIKTEPMFNNPMDNPRICALLEVIERGEEKQIIWCKYTHEIKTISCLLREIYGYDAVVEFYGEVNQRIRPKMVDKFADKARFFIANKNCASYSWNLQFCSFAIYYSNDFDYLTRSQSEDRIDRMGQKNKVSIIDLCAYRTIDSRILKSLARKENLIETFKREIEVYSKRESIRRILDDAEDISA